MDVLKDRMDALNNVIDFHQGWLGKWLEQQSSLMPRAEKLYCLLEGLKAFADPHFDYFYDGFSDGSLTLSKMYPPQHVLTIILDQIAEDLDVIRRAIADEVISTNSNTSRETLLKGDKLALDALAPAIVAGWLNDDIQALTYFQKSAAVRVFPYDNDDKTLIGIPFTSTSVTRDYLATPHETGHFVFWNAKIDGVLLRDKLYQMIVARPDIPRWVRKWTEEIFADVYGCLVAGPLIALDFQDLQMLESSKRFVKDDGEHPAPVVRPYVYTEALKRMSEPGWAGSLERRWAAQLKKRGNPTRIFLEQSDLPMSSRSPFDLLVVRFSLPFIPSVISGLTRLFNTFEVSVEDARKAISQVVGVIFKLLKDLDEGNFAWGGIDYSKLTPPAGEDPKFEKQLYDEFAANVSRIPVPQPEPRHSKSYPLPYCTPVNWPDWYRDLQSSRSTGGGWACNDPGDPDWCLVWIADGWATKGPQIPWT